MSIFTPVSKKGNTKECAGRQTIALISHTSKVMLNILHARLQRYVNLQILDVQAGSEKEEKPEIKLLTFSELQRKLGNSRKTPTSVSLTEKAMAPHCSTLAWKIPWTEEPGRLQSMGSLRVGHD